MSKSPRSLRHHQLTGSDVMERRRFVGGSAPKPGPPDMAALRGINLPSVWAAAWAEKMGIDETRILVLPTMKHPPRVVAGEAAQVHGSGAQLRAPCQTRCPQGMLQKGFRPRTRRPLRVSFAASCKGGQGHPGEPSAVDGVEACWTPRSAATRRGEGASTSRARSLACIPAHCSSGSLQW